MTATPTKVVALFVRAPVPGRVKTRLGREIGMAAACDLYQAMVSDILSAIASSNVRLFLFHDDADCGGIPKDWIDAASAVIAQQGDTIGERMAAAFARLFSENIPQVALIGSDIPGMDADLLAAAFQALATHDVALAPAVDGGYCLIGLTAQSYRERIFQDIAWSTERVLQTTLNRCAECGLQVTLLASRQDIDTLADLALYCQNPLTTARTTNEWLAASGYIGARNASPYTP
jgi:rSAM/selenodomain-associated transferase 1